MTKVTKRASFDELLAFANQVRELGGGESLNALMPAVPMDMKQCLIAKNLNFRCQVFAVSNFDEPEYRAIEVCECSNDECDSSQGSVWGMYFTDPELRDTIATGMGLPTQDVSPESMLKDFYVKNSPSLYAMILPAAIGKCAADFDKAQHVLGLMQSDHCHDKPITTSATASEIQLVQDMLPYIDAAKLEAHKFGFINDEGKLVL